MRIKKRFTEASTSPYDSLVFTTRKSEIRNPDGSVAFLNEMVQVPESWSQVATDIIAQKYFRKAGIPVESNPIEEEGVPQWLWRHEPAPGTPLVGETDSRQVFDRLAGCWTYWGWKEGYFEDEASARAYFDEMRFMLASQMAAPNSPQWFNTGLNWAYGLAVLHRVIGTAITRKAKRSEVRVRMSGLSLTLASFSPWAMTWSTRAASWTFGFEKLDCSSMALVQEAISLSSVANVNRSLVVVSQAG
jgi:hypothetical protein